MLTAAEIPLCFINNPVRVASADICLFRLNMIMPLMNVGTTVWSTSAVYLQTFFRMPYKRGPRTYDEREI